MQEKIAERAKLWYKKDNKSVKEVFPCPKCLILSMKTVSPPVSVPRTTAHAEGLRHRTSHVWIVRRKNGRVQVLLQMRCAAEDSYPGCYDISSAGHIPAGAEFVGSALRELREELGVTAAADLHECGLRRFRFEAEFHGKPFKDDRVKQGVLPLAGPARPRTFRAEVGDRASPEGLRPQARVGAQPP